ncbi:SCO family protein [Marinobacter zhejiangensis]|uniref:Protein SCO1/2 n=1 Tax=Marinobacter zhejiangensis TaxID=488535 RepID=A0A1I4LV41_9GAMM|nr:SCO family protein [Marinobacter zhejiangensis]SFL94437.1 protein SCO1/2 [Marinobacter zhejiangensis]
MDRSVRNTVVVLLLAVVLVFGLVVGRQVFLGDSQAPLPAPELSELNTFVYDQGRPVAAYQLVNEQGEAVTQEDLKGHWTFAFVGYTFCPDVCPATLSNLRRANQLIPAELPRPSYLLISADPERDTPERLREYLAFFGEDFQGITGDLDTLRNLAKSLNAVFIHRQEGDLKLVDHSAHLALINPEGELAAVIQPPHKPEAVAEAFGRIYQWARQNRERAVSP